MLFRSDVLSGTVTSAVGMATHYHANYVSPYWAPTLVKMVQIGAHIFYRWTGGWGQPGAFGGRYEGSELEGMQIAALDRLEPQFLVEHRIHIRAEAQPIVGTKCQHGSARTRTIAPVHHADNPVAVTNRGKPVRDDDDGAAIRASIAELGLTKEALLADTALLTRVLTYHVVPGKVMAKDVKAGKVKSVQGTELTLGTTGGVTVDNATVVKADIMTGPQVKPLEPARARAFSARLAGLVGTPAGASKGAGLDGLIFNMPDAHDLDAVHEDGFAAGRDGGREVDAVDIVRDAGANPEVVRRTRNAAHAETVVRRRVGQARREVRVVLNRGQADLVAQFGRDGRDGHRDVLNRFFPLVGRDDDDVTILAVRPLILARLGRCLGS